MLLKSGYRHVYISRVFARKNGFIPSDAKPGMYGYGGLVKYVHRSSIKTFTDAFGLVSGNGLSQLARKPQRIPSISQKRPISTVF